MEMIILTNTYFFGFAYDIIKDLFLVLSITVFLDLGSKDPMLCLIGNIVLQLVISITD